MTAGFALNKEANLTPDHFSKPAFASIAGDSAAHFPRDRNTVARSRFTRWEYENRKERRLKLLAPFINQLELISRTKRAQLSSDFGLLTHLVPGLVVARREPLPPLSTAPLQNEPARLGAHALSEPVRFGPAPVIRLKCSFHS